MFVTPGPVTRANTDRSCEKAVWSATGTIAPLPNAGSPALKFRLDTTGRVIPVGNMVRKPVPLGPTAVRLTVTALAPTGTPHTPWTTKVRVVPSGIGEAAAGQRASPPRPAGRGGEQVR